MSIVAAPWEREAPAARPAAASVLLVDDRAENLTALEAVLQPLGHHLVTARSGSEALKRLLQRDFALILLDVHMPEMDGFETARWIRSRERSRRTPIIFLTAISKSEAHVAQGFSHGAVDYMVKPFDPDILRAKVSALVELWQKTNALAAEVERRAAAEADLRELSLRLEQRVVERTQELATANWALALAKEEAEERLRRMRELEALRDDLTHMIVHDLRTPLTAILTGLQSIEGLGPLNEDQETCLQVATSGGELLLSMINDLLDISKLESGTLTLERQSIEAEPLVRRALRTVESLASDKGVELRAEIAEGLLADVDAEKLGRVVMNLVGNAVKFTSSGGSVTVGANPGEGGDTLFFVRDTGEGIPPEAFERIFEKFGQVETRKAGRRNSTGLGLTFCKMAVEAHGGRIWVESELGSGSTFWFTIPGVQAPSDR